MLHVMKDDFDETPEDILKTINKILNNPKDGKQDSKEEKEN